MKITCNFGIGDGDTFTIDFIDIVELIEYIDEIKRFKEKIWVVTSEGSYSEIFITADLYTIKQLLLLNLIVDHKNTNNQTIFVQEYDTYEAAYKVALLMREGHPKCYYNSENERSKKTKTI